MSSVRRLLRSQTVQQTSVAFVDQALNSGTNFLVGVILIRSAAASEYGLFVLANAALVLAHGFQHAVVSLPMTVIAPKRAPADRLHFVNALTTTQFALWVPACIGLAVVAYALGQAGWLDDTTTALCAVTALAAIGAIAREFFRQLFFVFGRPTFCLAIDAVYTVLFLVAAVAYTASGPQPALLTIAAIGLSSVASAAIGMVLYRAFLGGGFGFGMDALRETLQPARWGVPGMILAWLQNQGFFYLLGALQGTAGVAIVGAARMLLVPIPMMLTAVESILRPRAANWLATGEHERLTRQLVWIGLAASAVAVVFTALVFAFRDFILTHVFRKVIPDLEVMLTGWGVVFLTMIARTNLKVLLQALERFDVLFYLTLVRGVVSLALCYLGIQLYGTPGVLLGLAIGEVVYIAAGYGRGRRELAKWRPVHHPSAKGSS